MRRESAVARLRILGGGAVDRLASLAASQAPADARAAALKTLEGLDDERALKPALRGIADADAGVAVAAIGVLRDWVTREAGTSALDALTGAALDTARDPGVRLAALDALSELPRDLVQAVRRQVPADTHAVQTFDDPVTAREWLSSHQRAPFSTLHDFVTVTRERERAELAARRRQDWVVARGAAHAALARRGSRVALYDLRESFDATQGPLPLDFLVAVSAVGDASCLEPLARAWIASPGDDWWRDRLRDAAADIMKRGKLTARHAAVKRIRTKFQGFV